MELLSFGEIVPDFFKGLIQPAEPSVRERSHDRLVAENTIA